MFHPSTCESPNKDNHDILNAYLCNVIRGPEAFKNTSAFPPMQTSLMGAWGAWSLLVGPQVCEYGDCGSITNTNEVAVGSLVKVMGHLKVEVYGDLPLEVEADVTIQQVATIQDPTTYPVQNLGLSAILHPENPGTYQVLVGAVKVEGVTYNPHLEQRFETGWMSLPGSRVEVLAGRLTHIRVVYEMEAP